MRNGALFAGYGGLDLAVEAVFGARTVWHSEFDPAASKVLETRWPGVPSHGDITRIDWTAVEPVDVLSGGWPCQPFSLAGKRKGAADERALWPYVARAVRMVRPRYVVLENVAAIITAGELARAVADLAAIGYVGSWICLRASDVGAPHRRERCFILATDAAHVGHERGRLARGRWPGLEDGRGPVVADATGDGRHQGWAEPTRQLGRPNAPERSATPADAERPSATWGAYGPAVQRWEHVTGRVAPAPTELSDAYRVMLRRRVERRDPRPVGRRGSLRPRLSLSPAFVEWMMGLDAGWVTGVPGLTRNDQLRMLGNGVVPQQATAALEAML